MRHNNDILAPLQLHDDRFQPNYDVAVGLSATVTIVILVIVAGFEVFRILFCDVGVGEAIADARIELVECFPFELAVAFVGGCEEASRLNGTFERGSPDGELSVIADGTGDEFRQLLGVELAPLRDIGVTADFTGEVELGLAVAGEPDRTRANVEIHEVVDDTRLEIVLNLVDNDLFADVDEFDVGEVLFVFVDGLIDFFVVADAVAEILSGNFRILAFVVGGGGLDFKDVAHDDFFVVALRLHVEGVYGVGVTPLSYPSPPRFCRVCCIQYRHDSLVFLEPFDHV